ncbi:LysM repeat protein [Tenacibaculum adriaticum]|uniref:LysM repeat protein n=1 Tax=Tenacibaculum adriaticum TaxID=413713 RepID=A0A5S5DT22_9FLAO|nr:LysM peptidoglycan-binding domain-containing protein [Tenacibaculum adriaticum]TYP98925.1 LysM repeat protein [Tenacibaculum adriaticum]
MKRIIAFCVLLFCFTAFSQERELPEGWDKILLEGKIAYMNLVTGDVSTMFPEHAAKKPETIVEYDPTVFHKVEKGETLSTIARKYNMNLAELYKLNNLENFDTIEVGQEIVLGYEDEKDSQNKVHKTEGNTFTDTSSRKLHSVKSGETLFKISKKYNIPVSKLKQINNLQTNNIFVGQQLKVQF